MQNDLDLEQNSKPVNLEVEIFANRLLTPIEISCKKKKYHFNEAHGQTHLQTAKEMSVFAA